MRREQPSSIKALVPGTEAHKIEKKLSVAGIDELRISRDLDELGRWLTSVLREEAE
jgi:predicted nuclease with TOPRIM domain